MNYSFPVIIVCGFILLLHSCKKKEETIQPETRRIVETVYASGLVKARSQYQVYAIVSGLVSEILVKENDSVKAGQVIMKLSDANTRLQVENARISADYAAAAANQAKLEDLKLKIELSKASMDNAYSLLKRQRALWEQHIGTRNELDQRELAFTNAEKAYQSARLQYGELQRQINFQAKQAGKNLQISQKQNQDFAVKSEVNGKVYSILREKGEMVTPQNPVAILGASGAFYMELQVDEYDIARIREGQKIWVSMDSYWDTVFEASVHKINPLMNERSKSFTIEAEFVQIPPVLYPNLSCEANIVLQSKEKALTIPRAYLLADDQVELSDGRKLKVKTGLKDYQVVEILEGLTEKDKLKKPAS